MLLKDGRTKRRKNTHAKNGVLRPHFQARKNVVILIASTTTTDRKRSGVRNAMGFV